MSRNFKDLVDRQLSALTWNEADTRATMDKLKGERPAVKRKFSASLVFAMAALLALTGVAVAAGLGAFSTFATEWNLTRLEHLDEAAQDIGVSVSASAPQQAISPAPAATLYDEILAYQDDYDFTLTLDKAYSDGQKLYYAYTLRMNRAPQTTFGEGKPSGFGDDWTSDYSASPHPGGNKLMNHISFSDEQENAAFRAWFDPREEAYAARDYVSIGDGCDLADGRYCNIYDRGDAWIDETTLSGFQEVELPENAVQDGKVDIVLTIGFGTAVYYQNAKGTYRSDVRLPRPDSSIRVPFTVNVSGQTSALSGRFADEDFTAEAELTVTDVEIFGTITMTHAEEVSILDHSPDYALIAADGTKLRDLEGATEQVDAHTIRLHVEYDLPENLAGLKLRPETPDAENGNRDIALQ